MEPVRRSALTLSEIETPDGTRVRVVLHSRDGAERVVLIELHAGDALGEHQAPWPAVSAS